MIKKQAIHGLVVSGIIFALQLTPHILGSFNNPNIKDACEKLLSLKNKYSGNNKDFEKYFTNVDIIYNEYSKIGDTEKITPETANSLISYYNAATDVLNSSSLILSNLEKAKDSFDKVVGSLASVFGLNNFNITDLITFERNASALSNLLQAEIHKLQPIIQQAQQNANNQTDVKDEKDEPSESDVDNELAKFSLINY